VRVFNTWKTNRTPKPGEPALRLDELRQRNRAWTPCAVRKLLGKRARGSVPLAVIQRAEQTEWFAYWVAQMDAQRKRQALGEQRRLAGYTRPEKAPSDDVTIRVARRSVAVLTLVQRRPLADLALEASAVWMWGQQRKYTSHRDVEPRGSQDSPWELVAHLTVDYLCRTYIAPYGQWWMTAFPCPHTGKRRHRCEAERFSPDRRCPAEAEVHAHVKNAALDIIAQAYPQLAEACARERVPTRLSLH
jgi:hypothetical protein